MESRDCESISPFSEDLTVNPLDKASKSTLQDSPEVQSEEPTGSHYREAEKPQFDMDYGNTTATSGKKSESIEPDHSMAAHVAAAAASAMSTGEYHRQQSVDTDDLENSYNKHGNDNMHYRGEEAVGNSDDSEEGDDSLPLVNTHPPVAQIGVVSPFMDTQQQESRRRDFGTFQNAHNARFRDRHSMYMAGGNGLDPMPAFVPGTPTYVDHQYAPDTTENATIYTSHTGEPSTSLTSDSNQEATIALSGTGQTTNLTGVTQLDDDFKKDKFTSFPSPEVAETVSRKRQVRTASPATMSEGSGKSPKRAKSEGSVVESNSPFEHQSDADQNNAVSSSVSREYLGNPHKDEQRDYRSYWQVSETHPYSSLQELNPTLLQSGTVSDSYQRHQPKQARSVPHDSTSEKASSATIYQIPSLDTEAGTPTTPHPYWPDIYSDKAMNQPLFQESRGRSTDTSYNSPGQPSAQLATSRLMHSVYYSRLQQRTQQVKDESHKRHSLSELNRRDKIMDHNKLVTLGHNLETVPPGVPIRVLQEYRLKNSKGQLGDLTRETRPRIELVGDLMEMIRNWDLNEAKHKRRLVRFVREQDRTHTRISFFPIKPEEYEDHMCVISCIWRRESHEYCFTSVDGIYLLEYIIQKQFPVEEKNRVRRNLEICKPTTITKSKPILEPFFRQIMGYDPPRPRTIEKDVKVFLWSTLESAMTRIVAKYDVRETSSSSINENDEEDDVDSDSEVPEDEDEDIGSTPDQNTRHGTGRGKKAASKSLDLDAPYGSTLRQSRGRPRKR